MADQNVNNIDSLRDEGAEDLSPTFAFSRASNYGDGMEATLSRSMLSDFGSSGQVDSLFSVSSLSQLAWWSCFSTPPRVSSVGVPLSSTSSSLLQVSSRSLPGISSSARRRDRRSRTPARSAAPTIFTLGSLKSLLVRMRPWDFAPHGYAGADGGSCLTGASDGLVRTRSCL